MRFIIIALLLPLSGCMQTVAQKQDAALRQGFNTADAEYGSCVDSTRIKFAAQYDVVGPVFILSEDDPSQLTKKMNTNQLTEAQKTAALEIWQGNSCSRNHQQALASLSARHGNAMGKFLADIDDLRVSILTNKITVGEYNTNLMKVRQELFAEFTAADNEILAGLNQQHNAELERRQRAAAAYNAYRPRIATCTSYGSTVTCNSY